jgi:phosphoglycolate phosphatase
VGTRRAALFDLDGTLVDSNLSIRSTMNAVLAERGLAPFAKAELDGLIGQGLRAILAQRFPAPGPRPGDLDRMTLRYRAIYMESGWAMAEVYPGLEDAIGRLRGAGWRVGVVTNKGQAETETMLRDLGVARLFDAAVGDDDVRPLKPDPAPVVEACRRLGAGPTEAVMVGDTRFDVQAAHGAGLPCIGVTWGNGTRASLVAAGAEAIVDDVKGLERALRAA